MQKVEKRHERQLLCIARTRRRCGAAREDKERKKQENINTVEKTPALECYTTIFAFLFFFFFFSPPLLFHPSL